MTRKKKPIPKPRCKKGCTSFSFKTTDKGVKRTCTVCGTSVTEVGKGPVNVVPLKKFNEVKRQRYHENKLKSTSSENIV